MSLRKHGKKSELLLRMLKERSRKSLEFAKESILAEKIDSDKTRQAFEYYTSNWKIFIHPGLFSIACEAVGGNPKDIVPIQAAMSMLAAAFDIHDDIIDNSKTKQGQLTVLGKFGRSMTLLLGDAFLVEGFTLFHESSERVSREKRKSILRTLQRSFFELGNAHAIELDLKRKNNVAPDEYMQVLKMKAASIEADMQVGAVIGGGSDSEVEALTKYGRKIGILSTLREEFADMYDLEELQQRIKNEYFPIPMLYAFQNETARRNAQHITSQRHMNSKDLEKMTHTAFQTKEIKSLRDSMKELIVEAIKDISLLNDSTPKLQLRQFASVMLADI